jgi:hypothetical protein
MYNNSVIPLILFLLFFFSFPMFFLDKPWLRLRLNFFKKGTSLGNGGEEEEARFFWSLEKEEPKKEGLRHENLTQKKRAIYQAIWDIDLEGEWWLNDVLEKISEETGIEEEKISRILYEMFETGFFRDVEVFN